MGYIQVSQLEHLPLAGLLVNQAQMKSSRDYSNMKIRGAYRRTCLMTMFVVLSLQTAALATSGWDSYTFDISGGYEIHGNAGMLTVRRDATVEIVGMSETKNEPIVGFANTDNHLFLCTVPRLDVAAKIVNWTSPYPFNGSKVWVLEKNTAKFVGPMLKADLTKYCEQSQISLGPWVSAEQMGKAAMDEKAWFALFLGLISNPYLLITALIVFSIVIYLVFLLFFGKGKKQSQ